MKAIRILSVVVPVVMLVGLVLGTACAGVDGTDGVGIESAADNGDGTFTLNMTDGSRFTTPDLTGPKGDKGDTGEQGPQGEQGPLGLPGAGVLWRGEWSASTEYSQDDAVGYLGSSFISKHDGNIGNLPIDADCWDVWVEKGDTGPQGPQGEPGSAGPQGEPGPNMIVAMGNIAFDGTINQSYNVDSVYTPDEGNPYYEITLTGIYYEQSSYVTMVNPADTAFLGLTASYTGTGGKLIVHLCSGAAMVGVGDFSFVVLECP